MDLSPFKQDIDELIREFNEGDFRALSDMKKVWLARKFSYIFDSQPANLALFMQSLFDHCVGHMAATYSLSHRLGGLYCLYCLYEIQPFKPPFKIYLSLGEMRILKALAIDVKKEGIKVASNIVRRLMERNAFLFGFVDLNDYSEAEMLEISKHKAMLQKMHEKLFADVNIEEYLHMDLGKELDLSTLQKIVTEYGGAKELVLKVASKSVDVQDIKHIGENSTAIADNVKNVVEDWNQQKDAFCKETRFEKNPAGQSRNGNGDYGQTGSVQQLDDEDYMGDDESLPPNGFMQLLTGEENEQDGSQEIQVEEIEQLLESDYSQEEDLSYADDLEQLLSGL